MPQCRQKQNSSKFKQEVNLLAQLEKNLEVCLQEWLDPEAQREIRVLFLYLGLLLPGFTWQAGSRYPEGKLAIVTSS